MDVTITVRVCDICKDKDKPATRYSLTPDGDETVTRDLCHEDAAPVLAVFDLTPEGAPESVPSEDKPPAQRKAPAAKAEKKAPARTTSRRRGKTPVRTLEQIEAAKKAAQS
jgi:hypothetical protein